MSSNKRDLDRVKRITVKVGTNILSCDTGINIPFLEKIGDQVAALKERGYEILLVTSGAIGMGAGELGITERVVTIPMRQACASIGQPLLMHNYREVFRSRGLIIAQILLTREVLDNRLSYLNLQNSVETTLSLGALPIFNENDVVSTAEIGSAFGDNDTLSAYIASKTDSDLLIILSDIDGLYNKDPGKYEDAEIVPFIEEVTDEIRGWAVEGTGSTFSTGGMMTKLVAADIASKAGCASIIADGRQDHVLIDLVAGVELGTYFAPKEKMPHRTRWILNTQPAGTIHVDKGALSALRNHKSLLPIGVVSVDGVFGRGTVVMINDEAKVVTSLTSEEIRSRIGYRSAAIKERIGEDEKVLIARPEDIVFL